MDEVLEVSAELLEAYCKQDPIKGTIARFLVEEGRIRIRDRQSSNEAPEGSEYVRV